MSDVLDRPSASLKVVGTRPIRPDGADKVTGRALYGADFAMAGQLHGRILRSPHAHARILSINTAKAKALPGVKAVVTGADFPDPGNEDFDSGETHIDLRDIARNVMARDKALYDGHAVAAVAATSPAIAAAALDLIEVSYELLPHVVDVEAAMAPGAPLLHPNLITQGLESPPANPSNVAKRVRFARGDLDAGFAEADVIVEGRYVTRPVHQGYIEPHACVAAMRPDGQAEIWSSTQGGFTVRTMTAKILMLDIANLRVTPSEIGGGFGGKTVVYLEPVALALSQQCGLPVKLVMSRDEVFRATGPTSASVGTVRLGAKADGKIIAAEVDLKFQAGAFPGSPVGAACVTALACYEIPNFRITGWDVVTNTPKVAAYRAPGAPNSAFAVESAMDELALKLGMDPIALREVNALRNGRQASYGPTLQNIGFIETLAAAKTHPNYQAPLGPHQGRGVASGFWMNIGGESTAIVNLTDDGGCTVATGNPDIGGSRASMAMMAAEVLGLPIEKVRAIVADTASIGFSQGTGGSRTTFATGMAVVEAAQKVVVELKARAALIWNAPADAVVYADGEARWTSPTGEAKRLDVQTLARQAVRTGGPIAAQVSLNAQGAAPCFAVHVCDVEVDPETGVVTVLRYTAVQDVGKAIHPSYVEGQMQGGVAQGVGWALNEEYVFDADGRMENAGFLDYRVPVASDLPMIDTIMIEVPNPRHPFGVKGVGEVPIVPPLAAVANAVRAATGVRVPELPLSPPRLAAALGRSER